jgi:hypothetical protein
MNTHDIRNMDSNQWLFWATALPVTLMTISIALLVAYKADSIRGQISQHFGRTKAHSPGKTEILSASEHIARQGSWGQERVSKSGSWNERMSRKQSKIV